MIDAREVGRQFIVAGGDAAELFPLVIQSFDTIPLATGGSGRPTGPPANIIRCVWGQIVCRTELTSWKQCVRQSDPSHPPGWLYEYTFTSPGYVVDFHTPVTVRWMTCRSTVSDTDLWRTACRPVFCGVGVWAR